VSAQQYTAIVLNGGFGQRTKANQPKQFIKLNGLPILAYCLLALQKVAEVERILLNFPAGSQAQVEEIVKDFAITKPVEYVEAGATRHESVSKMLDRVKTDWVFIVEAARPFVSAKDFEDLAHSDFKNVSLTLPIPFTVAPVEPSTSEITGSLERDKLRNIQLPQKFWTEDLKKAHLYALEHNIVATEDATLVAQAGLPVHFINGPESNFKITTPFDLALANYMMRGETEYDD
jgi:2-C-methyl-D-erythritol 4-phosphate cytidylyltransferase